MCICVCICVCVCVYVRVYIYRGFPGGRAVKNPCQFRKFKRHRFNQWVGKIPWRQPSPIILPGKFHEQRNLAGYSPWSRKESDTTEHTHTYIYTYIYVYTCITEPLCSAPETNTTLLISCGSIKKKEFLHHNVSHFQIILVLPNYPLD